MWHYNGKDYARVSDIVNPLFIIPPKLKEVFEAKAALGTRVHDAINKEILGELPTVIGDEVGYFQSFLKWRDCIGFTVIETEKRYYCDEKMITGCIDLLVTIQGEKEALLVDFKTSASESPITWPMQAHLYHYLIRASGREVAPRFLFVKLDRHGGLPKVFQYKFDGKTMDRCLQAIEDFWAKNKDVALNTPEVV